MKELHLRTLTGGVYALVLLGAPLAGPWFFFGVYLALALFTLQEFFTLSRLEGARPLWIPGILTGLWLFTQQFLFFENGWGIRMESGFLLLILLLFLTELFRDQQSPLLNLGMVAIGTIYIGIPFGLLPAIVYFDDALHFQPALLFFILIIIWVHDTGAYLTGITLGRTPLMKKISPKKTVEGLAGGLLLGGVAVWVFSLVSQPLNLPDLLVLGLVIMLSANLGDLFESKWKRHLGIKDSGQSLPGHGGWLDRLDSFLIAVPAAYLTLIILG